MGAFIGGKVWPELTALVRSCRHRRRVAVAYLGADAAEVLPLRRGDVLVVAATHANASAGAINPDSLQAYLKLGVEVWAHPRLHAKVFRLGPVTVVGSPNASPTSTRLDEAATVSRSKATEAAADDFIDQLIEESVLVDEQLVGALRSAWSRRTRRGAPGVAAPQPTAWPGPDQRVFIFQSVEEPLTPAQERALEDEEDGWRRRVGPKSRWALEYHVCDLDDLKRCRAGDIIVYDHTTSDGNRELWAPAEALTDPVRLGRTRTGVIPLKTPTNLRPIDYADANTRYRTKAGRSIGRPRKLTDQHQIDALYALFDLPTDTTKSAGATSA